MKIKKTIKKEETVEVDVTLPYFSKDGNCYFVILSETRAIRVYILDDEEAMHSTSIHYSNWLAEATNGTPITAKEFEDAYEKSSDYLHTKFESMRDTLRDRKYGVNDNLHINEGEESESELNH